MSTIVNAASQSGDPPIPGYYGNYPNDLTSTYSPSNWTTTISPYTITTRDSIELGVDHDEYGLEVDASIKLGGRDTNEINLDLSRFTLIRRLRFFYDLIFRGKATMEVEPKLIKLEKALDVLRNAK